MYIQIDLGCSFKFHCQTPILNDALHGVEKQRHCEGNATSGRSLEPQVPMNKGKAAKDKWQK